MPTPPLLHVAQKGFFKISNVKNMGKPSQIFLGALPFPL
jgi:hypothetical protein